MAELVDKAFLEHVVSLSPASAESMLLTAGVAFAAANRPEAVPGVFLRALADVGEEDRAGRMALARKFRDALFKTGLLCGFPRAINALAALHEVMPEELRAGGYLRDVDAPMEEHVRRGKELFDAFYGDTAAIVQGSLDASYPDMGWFSRTVGYGIVYGDVRALSAGETALAIVAALVAMDAPVQLAWHMQNALRSGAGVGDVGAVRAVAVAVGERAGVVWRAGVPQVPDAPM